MSIQLDEIIRSVYTKGGVPVSPIPAASLDGSLRDEEVLTVPVTLPMRPAGSNAHFLLVCQGNCTAQIFVTSSTNEALKASLPVLLGSGGAPWLAVPVPLATDRPTPVRVSVRMLNCPDNRCRFMMRGVFE